MKNQSDDLLNRIQFLEKVYILSKKHSEKPALNRYFSIEKVGALLGFDKLQALEISEQLAERNLAVKQTLSKDRIGIKLAPKGVKTIENMQHQKKRQKQAAKKRQISARSDARSEKNSLFYFMVVGGATVVTFIALAFVFGLF